MTTRNESFDSYIYKLLKSQEKTNLKSKIKLSITKDAMEVLNQLTFAFFERIAEETGELCNQTKKFTMQARDVQTAVRLALPTANTIKGSLTQNSVQSYAISDGTKAVYNYTKSTKKNKKVYEDLKKDKQEREQMYKQFTNNQTYMKNIKKKKQSIQQ